MSGLVGYASSDDEDDEVVKEPQPNNTPTPNPTNSSAKSIALTVQEAPETKTLSPSSPGHNVGDTSRTSPLKGPQIDPDVLKDAPIVGPSLPTEEDGLIQIDDLLPSHLSSSSRPSSPYTTNRELLRNLTLPPVPNLDVPPSPPGTPPPGHTALTAKFENFLELKRTKGTHFNARISQSAAMRNPALMDKLLRFVGLDDPSSVLDNNKEGPSGDRGGAAADQYATVLPPDLWDPAAFPEWAFRGELRRAQDKMQQEREAERASGKRDAVEFVPSSSSTPGKRKSRFDSDGPR